MRQYKASLLALGTAALLQTGAARGQAAESAAPADEICSDSGRPWVRVELRHWRASAKSKERMLLELRASLTDVGIAACSTGFGPGKDPLATLTILSPSPFGRQAVHVTVTVEDPLTSKTVSRDLELGRFPEKARELALAIAADELLRVSWAEMSLRTPQAEAARAEAPPEVTLAVRRIERSPFGLEPSLQLGFRWVAYAEGPTQLGPFAAFLLPIGSDWGIGGGAGYRQGLDEKKELGTISSSAVEAELKLLTLAFGHEGFRVPLGLGVAAGRAAFQGLPGPGLLGGEHRAWFVVTRLGLGLEFSFGRHLLAAVDVGAGLPMRRAWALVDGARATGMAGSELSSGVALGWRP